MTVDLGLLFLLILLGGETVILSLIYLFLSGLIDLWPMLTLAAGATVASDSLWYCLGRFLPETGPFRSLKKFSRTPPSWFGPIGLWFIPASKFVYGTRIIAQIIAGSGKIKFWKYLVFDLFGIAAWLAILLAIGSAYKRLLSSFALSPFIYHITLGIPFLLLLILFVWLKIRTQKKYQ